MKHLTILGTGKVNLGGFVPAVLERTDAIIFLTSTNEKFKDIDGCALEGMIHDEYSVYFAEEEKKILDFEKEMNENKARVGIIPFNHKLFTELLEVMDGGIIFSACREGIYKTYLPLLNKSVTKHTDIFVFDNDENVAKIAKEVCNNTMISVYRCVIHSVSSSLRIDYDRRKAFVSCGKECLMVFPPEVKRYEKLFSSTPLWGRSEFLFTETEDEFNFFEKFKPLCINVPHTIACMKAYIKGYNMGLNVDEIASSRFNDIVDFDTMSSVITRAVSLLYDTFLLSYEKSSGMSKVQCVVAAYNFIYTLYNLPEEIIGRGLNVDDASFSTKMESHTEFIRGCSDVELNQILDDFHAIISK